MFTGVPHLSLSAVVNWKVTALTFPLRDHWALAQSGKSDGVVLWAEHSGGDQSGAVQIVFSIYIVLCSTCIDFYTEIWSVLYSESTNH